MRRGTGCYSHWCPACEGMHQLPDQGWTFNGSLDRPTFVPSFKHGGLRKERGDDGRPLDGTCHYTIADGLIQFHLDSWHKRTDIVAMPLLPKAADPFSIETQD